MSAKPKVELIFTIVPMETIALMSNISKTVTDTSMGSMKVELEYKTIPGLSVGIMTSDLEGHQN